MVTLHIFHCRNAFRWMPRVIAIVLCLLSIGVYGSGNQLSTSNVLIKAIENNDVKKISSLIEKGADPNTTDPNGASLLMLAAQRGQFDVANLLINHNASINWIHPNYGTALMQAAAKGEIGIVRLLVNHGANIHLAGGRGAILEEGGSLGSLESPTALLLAVRYGQAAVASYFLKKGANANTTDKNGINALMLASHRPDIVRLLLKNGAKADLVTSTGRSALEEVCISGDVECLSLLIQHGANINIRNQSGNTPLMVAVWNLRPTIVRELLLRGAAVNMHNNNGDSPLLIACGARDQDVSTDYDEDLIVSIIKMLIRNKANINVVNKMGENPINLAKGRGRKEVITLLKQLGASENIVP